MFKNEVSFPKLTIFHVHKILLFELVCTLVMNACATSVGHNRINVEWLHYLMHGISPKFILQLLPLTLKESQAVLKKHTSASGQ